MKAELYWFKSPINGYQRLSDGNEISFGCDIRMAVFLMLLFN